MPDTKKLVIIECGVSLSTFSTHFLKIGKFNGTILTNSICDFVIRGNEEEQKDLWVPLEIINVIKGLIPDDLSKSPLAMLYLTVETSKLIPLTPDDQFLANWLTKKRSESEKDYLKSLEELLSDICKTSNKPISVYPFSFDYANEVTVTYRDHVGPIRLYQMFGKLNFDKTFDINPNDMIESITESAERKFSFEDDKKVLTNNVKKNIDSANCIVLSPSDLTSFFYMLQNKEFKKEINDSEGTILIISPIISRREINKKESPLLKLINRNYSFEMLFDQIKDMCDTIVIDIGDTEMAKLAQEKGLQVILEDLLNVKDSFTFINSILNEIQFNILDISN